MAKSSKTESPVPYRWLAQYYDEIFTFHLAWFDAARRKILGSILNRTESACDLACGTGSTALALASRGIRMYGVDLSPTMCRLARQKARRVDLPLHVIHADMRDFRLPEPVNLVLCEFDALNHVPEKADLAAVVKQVAAALQPGGYFYFDVNNRRSFKTIWPGSWWFDSGKVVLVMHGGYDRARDRAWNWAEWFFRRGKLWQREREYVEQVCWSRAEIRRTLYAAGFDRLDAWDAVPFFPDDPAITRGCRTFYLARKRGFIRSAEA